MTYAFLLTGIVVALLFSEPRLSPLMRTVIALLVLLAICPSLDPKQWRTESTGLPTFFSSGEYHRYIQRNENIIALPYGAHRQTMLWQATTQMYFRMTVGYTSVHPREFSQWPITGAAFAKETEIPNEPSQLEALMAAHQVEGVIVDEPNLEHWRPLLSQIDPSPIRVGGVALFRPSSAILAL